ncbi:hypothetical protein KKB55_16825, partial [Myxococcota bacterium]|nr:hypothetical protein [Myxococcota bacterium]MBU1899408.1 hypothetical protein [Myxococcota bacterium]
MRHTHTLYLTLLIGGLLPWACDDGEGATPLDAMTQDTRLPDAAAPLPDAAAPLPDAAAPLSDAAAPLPDAAAPLPDA